MAEPEFLDQSMEIPNFSLPGFEHYLRIGYQLSIGGHYKSLGESQVAAVKGLDELIVKETKLKSAVSEIEDKYTKINTSLYNYQVYLHFNSNNSEGVLYNQLKTLFEKAGLPFSVLPTWPETQAIIVAERLLNESNRTIYFEKGVSSTQKPKGFFAKRKWVPIPNGIVQELKRIIT